MSLFSGDESILDPVIDEYSKHEGSVTSIKFSPTQNLFVTSGTDKEIRIYDFDQVIQTNYLLIPICRHDHNKIVFLNYRLLARKL